MRPVVLPEVFNPVAPPKESRPEAELVQNPVPLPTQQLAEEAAVEEIEGDEPEDKILRALFRR